MQQDELNKITNQLNEVFGSDEDLLTASYGKIHEYLGMTIDWTTEGKVVFTIYDYLEDILSEVFADFDGKDVTPAVSELFFVNLTQQKLDKATADLFHRIVAQFLYVTKRARSNLQVAVAFLCKQVKCLTSVIGRNWEDWNDMLELQSIFF